MELEIPDTDHEGWTVVAASGEIDVAAAPDLRTKLTDLVSEGAVRLVLDLDHVDFIDSTGLGVLVGAVRRARAAEGDVVVVTSNPRVRKVFDVTGLDEVFTIADSVDDAVAAATS